MTPEAVSDEPAIDAPEPDRARAAFRTLFERFGAELLGFLTHLLGERSLAEEALQETFVKAYQGRLRRDPRRSTRAWLFAIARNAAIDLARVERKHRGLLGKGSTPGPIPAEATAERSEAVARLRAALAALPLEERALLVERHFQEHTLDELATSRGCSERTIRNRLRRAAAKLVQVFCARKEALRDL